MQETLNTCHRIYLLHVPVLLQMLCGLSLVCVLYFTLFVFLYECACPNHCEQQFRQQAAKKNQRLLLTVQLVAHQTTMIRPSNHCAFWQFMGGGDGGNAAMMTCSSRVRSVWWKVFLWGSTLALAMLWTKCQSLRANISTMYNVWSCRRHDLWWLKEKRTDMAVGKVWLTVRQMKCQSHGSALL